MFVGRVVIADDVDVLPGVHTLLNEFQKLEPFNMSVLLEASRDHFSGRDLKSQEERGSPVALVIIGHGLS